MIMTFTSVIFTFLRSAAAAFQCGPENRNPLPAAAAALRNARRFVNIERILSGAPTLPWRSVSHRIDKIICGDAEAHRRKLLVVFRIVRPLPGIAEIHVIADRDDHTPAVVVDTAPVWIVPVVFVRPMRSQILRTRHLILVVKVVDR